MNVSELIEQLKKFDGDMEVMILDGFNGGGCPREINLGPSTSKITLWNAGESADCEGRAGEKIVRLGYGCY